MKATQKMILEKVVKLEKLQKRKLEFEEFKRYSRQLILPELGRIGQGPWFTRILFNFFKIKYRTFDSNISFKGYLNSFWWYYLTYRRTACAYLPLDFILLVLDFGCVVNPPVELKILFLVRFTVKWPYLCLHRTHALDFW